VTRLHRPRAGFWIRLCVLILYPLNSLLFRIRWHHLDRIPASGGVLLAVNHISQADPAAIARMIWQSGRIPRFLVKSSVFGWPLVGSIMRGAGQIPVHRGTADATASVRDAIAALRRGEAVIIYPEGTITDDPDYLPMHGRTGVARIALAVPDVPVLPVAQWGAHRTLGRRGRFRPLPRKRHEARVGRPIDLSRHRAADGRHGTDELRRATEDVMAAIVAELTVLREPDRNWL
jgi:1-acyl-sn-glycerol-3-phosphate acyltransferase